MKRQDIAIIGLVIVVSGVFSLVISRYIFAKPASRQLQVLVAGSIKSTFTAPSSTYFNSSSIDPTQTIQVNINANQSPFGNTPTPGK